MRRAWIAEAMAKAGINQRQLSEAVDVDAARIGRIIRGVSNPSVQLGCAITWYFEQEHGIQMDVLDFVKFESDGYWKSRGEKLQE